MSQQHATVINNNNNDNNNNNNNNEDGNEEEEEDNNNNNKNKTTTIILIILMMMMMVLVMMMMIIITLKGAIRGFVQSPPCAANCLQHVRSSGQGAIVCKSRVTYPAFIMCNMSHATRYKGTAQLLSLTELKLHLF